MGYLSQKKHQARENLFFLTTAAIIILLTAGSFADPGFCFGFFNLFHLYCLSGLLFLYALWRRKYKFIVFFALAWMVNYTTLSSAVNIFLSDEFNGKRQLKLEFAPRQELVSLFDKEDISAAGSLIIAKKYLASYAVVGQNEPLTLIQVDFYKVPSQEYPLIFKQLSDFISRQDTPVIIFGEFGIPAWSRSFKQFMNMSELSVKNKLLFTQNSSYNIFSMPGFYVLGFREMGVNNIFVDQKDGKRIVRILISFNPEQP